VYKYLDYSGKVNSVILVQGAMRYHKIPDETIKRLPVYLRWAIHLSQQGIQYVSSKDLAGFLGVNPCQVRKDFSYFGDFGTPGIGYSIEKLTKRIKKILRLDVVHKAALVGVGDLGLALLLFPGFAAYSFQIAAAFDIGKRKVGKTINGVAVEHVSKLETLKEREIDLGIIAVPRSAAQEITDELVKVGIRGILNFSPQYVTVPREVKVITIDIATDLACLPYYMPSS